MKLDSDEVESEEEFDNFNKLRKLEKEKYPSKYIEMNFFLKKATLSSNIETIILFKNLKNVLTIVVVVVSLKVMKNQNIRQNVFTNRGNKNMIEDIC
mmetsp:Transcript_6143/g.6304  ORF Transcript_6143/g.6304 Transcript_6143/m.6304 type:complete len:97 (+) Transcript_6143:742-1032(+)